MPHVGCGMSPIDEALQSSLALLPAVTVLLDFKSAMTSKVLISFHAVLFGALA